MATRKNSKKQSPHSRNAILWAIDPFQDQAEFHQHAVRVLRPLAIALKLKIQPLVVLGPFQLREWALGSGIPRIELLGGYEALRSWIEGQIPKMVATEDSKLLLKPLLLGMAGKDDDSLERRVHFLCAYAKKVKAPFLGLHSHARRGWRRIVMGSFAETCMLHATRPTIIVNPTCTPAKRISKIVFPTDLSPASLRAFDETLALAKRLRAAVQVLHCLRVPSLSVFYASPESLSQLTKELNIIKKKAQRTGEMLRKKAAAKGVNATFSLVESKGRFDPAEMILKTAHRSKAQLISMAARSNPAKIALVGATSREVTRGARCAVLLLRE